MTCRNAQAIDRIRALASSMVERKRSGLDSYVVFLGAGASISSGCSGMKKIVNDVLRTRDNTQFSEWQRRIDEATSGNAEYGTLLEEQLDKEKHARFSEIWSRLDRDSRYSILIKHLREGKSPSSGYVDLAHLIKEGYIKMVLSTNLDNLLETALSGIGLLQPEDFVVITNKKDRSAEVRDQLETSRAAIKLMKLHGTLESPQSYAFTPEEIFDFETTIRPNLSRIINQSLIVVGHSMEDRDLDMLFEEEGKEIHYVNPQPPKAGSRIDIILKVRRQGSIIDDDQARFDNFFQRLRGCIDRESDGESRSNSGPSIEDFLRCIGYDHEIEVPRSRFRHMPTLYVKPMEYDGICSKLEREHVVFIIGEPHLGKTYTAFHILWEYYKMGYEVFHVRHDRLVTLLHSHNDNMSEILLKKFSSEKSKPRIVHFDDPFGETMDRRTDIFAKGLDDFIALVRSYEHLRVVVTTRLNIFREVMAEIHDLRKVEELEKDIRVHTSYPPDILLKVLHRYVRFYHPSWANNVRIVAALDEKMPNLLPAPHNIEFFVRTSENLESLDDVLNHVNNCKEMVTALGEWIGSLPDYEQIFLIWLEIVSTANVLLQDTSTSRMNFESVYVETLAYLFKEKFIDGIPTSPFSRARDKFDMIILERHDKDRRVFDFVHPSYHEAFWYATQHKHSFSKWWKLLKAKVNEILRDSKEGRADMAQLRVIERYGTMNRNLDQLLLASAQSQDTREQTIALKHMAERLEQFMNLPQFSRCFKSIAKSGNEAQKSFLLELTDAHFSRLPPDLLKSTMQLIFDTNLNVRNQAHAVITRHRDAMPDSVNQCTALKTWRLVRKILPSDSLFGEDEALLYYSSEDNIAKHLKGKGTSTADFRLLLRLACKFPIFERPFMLAVMNEYHTLSKKKRNEVIKFTKSPRYAKVFVRWFSHHLGRWSAKQKKVFAKALGIRKMSGKGLRNLGILVLKIFDELPAEKKETVIEQIKSSPKLLKKVSESMRGRIPREPLDYSTDTLMRLVVLPEVLVKYQALSALLLRFKNLSNNERKVVNGLINDPPGSWVGGSVGQVTSAHCYTSDIADEVRGLPLKLAKYSNKEVAGALLAEMAQLFFTSELTIKEHYKTIMFELLEDEEAVKKAEVWMDYQLNSFDFSNKKYWEGLKRNMHKYIETQTKSP